MPNLTTAVRISTLNIYSNGGPTGYTWTDGSTCLNVSDGTIYKVAKGSFENSAVQFRRDEVTNPFLEGKFTVNALRDNVMETLAIYVYADDLATLNTRVDALTDAVRSNQFLVKVTLDNSSRVWLCYAADYAVNTQMEFLHSRMALVTVTLPRHPVVY